MVAVGGVVVWGTMMSVYVNKMTLRKYKPCSRSISPTCALPRRLLTAPPCHSVSHPSAIACVEVAPVVVSSVSQRRQIRPPPHTTMKAIEGGNW